MNFDATPSRPEVKASAMLGPLLSTAIPIPWVAPELLPLLISIWVVLLGGSWVFGRWNLRAIDVGAELPASAFAWEAVPVDLRLRNHSQSWAARDLLVGHVLSSERVRRISGYRPRLGAGVETRLEPLLRVPRRGRHTQYRVEVSSSFPFGLLRWRRQFEIRVDLLGLPRLGELRQTERVLPDELQPDRQRPRGTWRPGEFFALQEWRPGLPQRQIAWKASARRGELLVRQNQFIQRPAMHVILHLGTAARRRNRFAFERSISLAATLVESLMRRRQPVRVTLVGSSVRSWRPRPGRDGLNQVLIALAEVEADSNAPARIPPGLLDGGAVVLVHSGGLDPAPHPHPKRSVLDARDQRRLRAYFREARAMPARTRILRRA
ncbi:MAG: hypothetical protein CMJ94_12720 [Planctomycetes bacterium]|nr:hypothetical protein [Planctomycetota bacterium]